MQISFIYTKDIITIEEKMSNGIGIFYTVDSNGNIRKQDAKKCNLNFGASATYFQIAEQMFSFPQFGGYSAEELLNKKYNAPLAEVKEEKKLPEIKLPEIRLFKLREKLVNLLIAHKKETPQEIPQKPSIKTVEIPKKEDTLSEKVAHINSIEDNKQKVQEWAKLNSAENYVIIDKKACSATIYDKNGKEIKTFEVGLGEHIGDDFNDAKGLKPLYTTPAGEFTLFKNVSNKAEYGDFSLSLGLGTNKSRNAKGVIAMHKIGATCLKERVPKLKDKDLTNNRMSHGCINFLEEHFTELKKYIHGGLKTYVLPEEKDNKLMLMKNDEGELELTQTKYKRADS
jgi:hypothetical protein